MQKTDLVEKKLHCEEMSIMKVLFDNVLLAIKRNVSMTLRDPIGKYVSNPESWSSKNYDFGLRGVHQ